MWVRAASVAVALSSLQVIDANQLSSGEWMLAGSAPTAYHMEAHGKATDDDGATVSLAAQNVPTGGFGSATAALPAAAFRGHRLTLRAEVSTQNADPASIWLRLDRGTTMLLLENGLTQPLRGDADWTPRAITLPVPTSTTSIVYGVLLQGRGSVSVRHFRIEVGPALAADAKTADDATRLLDAAMDLVKTKALRRQTVDWTTVEPEIRRLAAGAANAGEAYPAIRMLLAELGDHHSFVMPPAQVSAFQSPGVENPRPVIRDWGQGIGYIAVPGYAGADSASVRAYATQFHDALQAVASAASCEWLVDLRGNTGGNMWPMLAGLQLLLGSGPLGTFEFVDSTSPPWTATGVVDVSPSRALGSLEVPRWRS